MNLGGVHLQMLVPENIFSWQIGEASNIKFLNKYVSFQWLIMRFPPDNKSWTQSPNSVASVASACLSTPACHGNYKMIIHILAKKKGTTRIRDTWKICQSSTWIIGASGEERRLEASEGAHAWKEQAWKNSPQPQLNFAESIRYLVITAIAPDMRRRLMRIFQKIIAQRGRKGQE
jgi:hypothetical protein